MIHLPTDRSLSSWISRHFKTCRMPAKPIPQHVEPFAQAISATLTWAQQYSAEMASAVPIANLRVSICNRLWNQWDIRMIPTDLELRYADLDGDVFQVPNDTTIIRLLEEYRPEWRLNQYNFLGECPADSRHSPVFSLTIDLSQGSPRRDFAITLLDTLRLPKKTIVTCISGSLWPGYKARTPTIQISSACTMTMTIYIMCSWRGAKPRTPGKAKLVILFFFTPCLILAFLCVYWAIQTLTSTSILYCQQVWH